VLFIGTKRQAQDVMEQEAQRARMPFVTHRWLGGMLTNFATIRKSIERIDQIDKLLAEGSVEKLPKKEVLRHEKERVKLLRSLSGVREMKRLPGAVFIIDPRKEHIAVREARKLNIPAIGLADTNCDPDDLDYVIPGNDDAIRAIRLFAGAIADTCIAGHSARKEQGSPMPVS
jgi:small subunit ribosomal protein S2